ncbi:MAG: hypothetical protein AAF616_11985 [Bacteroidota bacterium]
MRSIVSISIMSLLLFVSGVAAAQGYTFRVLANKGQNKVKKAGASTAVPLKTGATLNANDQLIASDGAYIGLMHKTGKTLEVRTPGTKKVSDLEKQVNTKTTSVTSRYAQFLANKMNEKEKPGYRSRLNATGAAKRELVGNEVIQVLVPDEATAIGDEAIISWDTPEGMEENTFIVAITNIFDEEIMKEEVTGNSIKLNFTSNEMENEEGLYIIKVTAKENMDVTSGDNIAIRRLSGEEAAQYAEALASLKEEIPADSPLSNVIYASFYEENGLIVDALTSIEQAINMNPDVDDFKVLKKDIIERNGIKVYEEDKDSSEE